MSPEPKKVTILNNLGISSSYNIAADSLNWSPVRLSTGASLFKNKISLNLAATLDPYSLDENNVRSAKFNISDGGGL